MERLLVESQGALWTCAVLGQPEACKPCCSQKESCLAWCSTGASSSGRRSRGAWHNNRKLLRDPLSSPRLEDSKLASESSTSGRICHRRSDSGVSSERAEML